MVLEKTFVSPLKCKEIQPVHPKGDQSWVFFGRTDAEAETPVLWPPLVKSWLIGKNSDAGRDCRQKEKGTTEDEMAGWHHQLDGHQFEWTPGVGDGQGVLVCCNSWGRKESDTTESLSWTELIQWLRSKESACRAEDLGSVPWLGRFPGGGHGNPLQYSCLENSMDRGAWQTTVHGVEKSRTWLSN